MGRSATGIIIFGIAYEEEGIDPDREFMRELGIDVDEHVYLEDVAERAMERKLGVERPDEFDWSVYERQDHETHTQARERGDKLYEEWKKTDEYKALKKHEKMISARIAEIGVETGYHCHADFGLRYIAAYCISDGGGDASKLDLEEMMSLDTEEMTEDIKRYCDLVKLPYQEPSWQLLGYYG